MRIAPATGPPKNVAMKTEMLSNSRNDGASTGPSVTTSARGSAREAPHSPQNFMSDSFLAPQCGHPVTSARGGASSVPQAPQNLKAGSFDSLHRGHRVMGS